MEWLIFWGGITLYSGADKITFLSIVVNSIIVRLHAISIFRYKRLLYKNCGQLFQVEMEKENDIISQNIYYIEIIK